MPNVFVHKIHSCRNYFFAISPTCLQSFRNQSSFQSLPHISNCVSTKVGKKKNASSYLAITFPTYFDLAAPLNCQKRFHFQYKLHSRNYKHIITLISESSLGHLFHLISKLLISLTLIACFHEYVIDFCPAIGPSMQPLIIGNGDLLVYERITYRLSKLRASLPRSLKWKKQLIMQRGDVVIAMSGGSEVVKICKRIVALPGDVVILPVNENDWSKTKPIDMQTIEDELLATSTDSIQSRLLRIPKGYVWLQGDNTEDSHDSRHYGPVSEEQILGKVVFRLWPPSLFGKIGRDSVSEGLQRQYINNISSEIESHIQQLLKSKDT